MTEERKDKLLKLKVDVDKGYESYSDNYEEKLKQFISGHDFMRWESAAMCARRMTMEADKLGLECFKRQFTGLRQNIARKDVSEVKNILSLIIVKRIQIQDVLK